MSISSQTTRRPFSQRVTATIQYVGGESKTEKFAGGKEKLEKRPKSRLIFCFDEL